MQNQRMVAANAARNLAANFSEGAKEDLLAELAIARQPTSLTPGAFVDPPCPPELGKPVMRPPVAR